MPSRLPSSSQLRLDRSHLLWCVAGAILLAFFVGSAVSEIFPNHFRTWHVNSKIEPTTEWARFWKASEPWVSTMAYVVSGVSGFIGVVRAIQGAWQTTVGRLATAFLFGLFVEMVRIGVQDGSVADKDVVPPTSLVLILLGLAFPVGFAIYDLARLAPNKRLTAKPDEAPAT